MYKILVVTNECYKSESANGFCIEKVIEDLEDKNCFIDVVSFGETDEYYKRSDKVNIYYINKNVGTSLDTLNNLLIRFVFHFVSPDISFIHAKKAVKLIQKLIEKNRYDLLITSSGGFVSQFIGLRVKEKYSGLTWNALFYDPPVSINFLYHNKVYCRYWKKIEESIVDKCDCLIMESSLFTKMKSLYKTSSKFIMTGIPLLVKKTECSQVGKMDSSKCPRIVFFGTLWRKIRNPQFAIELLAEKLKCEMFFYGGEETKDIIEGYSVPNVKYMGKVKHEDVFSTAMNYDFLLNLSNSNSIQTPSKIFEYLSFGMPIINIAQDPEDITIDIIDKYKNGINVLQGDESAENTLRHYFENNTLRKMDYDTVASLFPLNKPSYTSDILMNSINGRTDF